MVDGTDLGPLASSTSAIASAMILVVAFVLLILTITLIVATVLSYKFIGSGKFKNDAWMKIVIFGISLLGFVFTTNSYGFMAFCEAVFLAIPIGLSVVVLCDDSDDNEEEPKAIKEAEKETTKEPEANGEKKKKKNQKSNCKYYLQDLEKQQKNFAGFLRLQKELQNPFRLKKIQHIRYDEVENPQKIIALKKSKP